MKTETIYFPGLNGLRAISAIAVVIFHVSLNAKAFNLNSSYLVKLENGYPLGAFLGSYGVSIFFALSGFLITYLLQAEKQKQEIDIKKFYLRRILRIWPLYYLYLFISILVINYWGLGINFTALLLYIFYAANLPFALGLSLPLLYHYWSLGIEEQFYIFWPWLNKKINSLIKICIALIIVLLVVKLLVHFAYQNSLADRILHYARFQCLIIGALGSLLYKQDNLLLLRIMDNKVSQLICWGIMFLAAVNRFHIATVIDDEIISVVALCLIIGQINVKNRIINLDTPIFNFLGQISYGIYVIHPVLIFLLAKCLSDLPISQPYKYCQAYLGVLVGTIGISYLSFTYFEKYFLKLKEKFAVVRSSAQSPI
ncbi:hypothetical protein BEL04_07150 [Mucilaginibacter sp. PPCGB 2223]|uniref:acyltransferase family protein n=1 Tax=Mucilaginibacter sp. PPCGB 2223 TaxID=1886027 RepID=UPI00082543DF|nr:acyltransferase [Mucilaginibacter sp. PPCGB 2223]OCX54044.1 hypothetical protein BEL04_07150 [Mucilaginibacter sp. PPCGB 2223]